MNRMMEEENTNMEYALEVRGLTKHYGDFVLDQVSLQVPYGAVVWVHWRERSRKEHNH